MDNRSYFRFDDDNKTKYIFSQSSQVKMGKLKTHSPMYCIMDISHKITGLVQERRNSIAKALELHLSCINPSRYSCCFVVLCFVVIMFCYVFVFLKLLNFD